MEIYIYDKWTDNIMPEFVVGEQVTPSKIFLHEGKTTAPLLLSEADLIGTMDKNGIGSRSLNESYLLPHYLCHAF